jgi:hypothetical protein
LEEIASEKLHRVCQNDKNTELPQKATDSGTHWHTKERFSLLFSGLLKAECIGTEIDRN